MSNERLYEALVDILSEISEIEYPEIYEIVAASIDVQDETVYIDAFSIAERLHDADGTKLLPECVASFLLEVYEEALNKGSCDAACNIGSLYYTGRAGVQSYAKALEYYDIAAKGGSRQAQENLGYCYYYGRDTAVDYEKAFHYFALGAFDGHIRSLYKIGDMYRNGYYVKKNEREAFHIYNRCAETMTDEAAVQTDADVMMRLGDCHYNGIGTEVDYKTALRYYQLAEIMFFERLEGGDFLIRGCYDKVIQKQHEVREKLESTLPCFD